MRLKLTAISAVLVITLVGLGSVYAHTNQQPLSQQAYTQQQQEITTETDEQVQQLREDGVRQCQLTAEYLRGQYAQSQLTLKYRLDTYQTVLDRTSQLAVSLESQDRSAVDLRVNLAELSDRMAEFSADYSLYQSEVFKASNIACNEQTELRATVSRALSALRTAEHQAEQVEDYARSELTDTTNQIETEADDE